MARSCICVLSRSFVQNLLTIVFLYGIGFAFIFVFLALVNNKPHFFTAWGQRTLAIYLLHVYLVAPLVEFTQFEKILCFI